MMLHVFAVPMVPEMGKREGVHVFRGQADSKKAEFGHFGGEAVTSTRTDVCIKSRPPQDEVGHRQQREY